MIKVSVAIIEKNGKILIAKREQGPLKDKWEFPGGKIEPGETPEACVQRELFEELGMNADIEKFICSTQYHYGHESVELFAYKVKYNSGNPYSGYYKEMKWVKLDELSSYEFPEANAPIIKRLVL